MGKGPAIGLRQLNGRALSVVEIRSGRKRIQNILRVWFLRRRKGKFGGEGRRFHGS